MPRTGRPRKSADVECTCQKCERKFLAPDWAIRSGRGKFCSRECYQSAGSHRKRPGLVVKPSLKRCEMCGREFLTKGLGRPRQTQRFCSLSCSTNAKYRWGILKGGSKKGRIVNHESDYFQHLRPTIHPTTWNITWAAGIYEGEGWCGKGNSEMAAVGQKDRWLCDKLRDMFGGYVSDEGVYKSGKYEGKKRGFSWHISGPRARGFLMTIWKFLSPRRQEQLIKVL